MSAVAVDPATVPGAMQRTLHRELLDGGLIEFEEAPKGFLTKAGDPRKVPWRAYHYTAPGEGRRVRFPSTTGVLDEVCPKPGLPVWSEAKGIEGFLRAIQAGAIDPDQVTPALAVKAVRALKMGAEAAKNEAADRGLNVHDINEQYMLTGKVPKLSEHPKHHHGFIVAWTNCVLALDPEPVEVEALVVHPEDEYAGRLDLRARVRWMGGRRLETIDFKTQENAGIYAGAHYQVGLYERAAVRCGAEPAEGRRVIVLAANGEWDSMPADHDEWRIDAALAHWRAKKPIESLCESRNRAEKASRA